MFFLRLSSSHSQFFDFPLLFHSISYCSSSLIYFFNLANSFNISILKAAMLVVFANFDSSDCGFGIIGCSAEGITGLFTLGGSGDGIDDLEGGCGAGIDDCDGGCGAGIDDCDGGCGA
ncbi:MAG: hypothetical protein D6732_01530, partial [Methanobacteriota archaeon]